MTLEPRHERLLAVLARFPGATSVAALASATEWQNQATRKMLAELRRAGLAEQIREARYRITDAGRRCLQATPSLFS